MLDDVMKEGNSPPWIVRLVLKIPIRVADLLGRISVELRQRTLDKIGRIALSHNKRRGSTWSGLYAHTVFAYMHMDMDSDWEQILSHIEALPSLSHRTWFARSATALYWRRGRFDQAREAANYWCAITEQQSAQILREDQINQYKNVIKSEATEQLSEVGTIDLIKAFLEGIKMARIYPFVFLYQEYKRAHVARQILEWSKQQQDVAAKNLINVKNRSIRKENIIPRRPGSADNASSIESITVSEYHLDSIFNIPIILFGEELASMLGMPEHESKRLEANAEPFSNH